MAINRRIDDMFEYIGEDDNDDGDDYDDDIDGDDDNDKDEGYPLQYEAEEGRIVEVFDETDVWDANFDVSCVFDKEFVEYLTKFYDQHSDEEGRRVSMCVFTYLFAYLFIDTLMDFRECIHISMCYHVRIGLDRSSICPF